MVEISLGEETCLGESRKGTRGPIRGGVYPLFSRIKGKQRGYGRMACIKGKQRT